MRSGRGRAAVCRSALGRQRILDGVELGHHVAVEAVAGGLLRRSGSQRVRFSHQRDVSEEIDPVPVAQGSEEPGLGAVELDVGPERGSFWFRSASFASVLWRKNSLASITW